VVAGLFIHSLQRTRSQAAGFVSDGVLIVSANFQTLQVPDDQVVDLYHHMTERLKQLPGMREAAVTWFTPMTGRDARAAFLSLGQGSEIHQDSRTAYNSVSPGYFATLQIPMISGRDFANTDRDQNVCILNRSAAGFFFPRGDAVGKSVRSTDDENNRLQFQNPIACRVIGIVEDARFASLKEPAPRTIYFPLTTQTQALRYQVFLLRGTSNALASAAYRQVLAEFAPSTPLLIFLPLSDQIAELLGTDRLISILSGLFGGVALLLSGLGLYGLLATRVTRRTGEIGVRMALGANRSTVLKMILYEAARLLGLGAALGGIGILFASRLIRSALFDTSPAEPSILADSLLVLSAVALVAAFIPAWRAATLDPMKALRSE
jgi:predicted permease